MSTVSIRVIMSGNWASRAALLCALFSTVPPVSSSVPAGIDLRSSSSAPAMRWLTRGRLQPRQRLRLHGDGGQAAAAPDIALVEIVLEIASSRRGTEAPVGVVIWRLRQGLDARALVCFRPAPRHRPDRSSREAA